MMFSGTDEVCFEEFIDDFRQSARSNQWDQKDYGLILGAFLHGAAYHFYRYTYRDDMDFATLCDKIRNEFPCECFYCKQRAASATLEACIVEEEPADLHEEGGLLNVLYEYDNADLRSSMMMDDPQPDEQSDDNDDQSCDVSSPVDDETRPENTDENNNPVPLLHRLKIARPKVMFCSLDAYKTHNATFKEVGSIEHYVIYGDEGADGATLFKDFLTETAILEDFQPVPVNGWEDLALIVYSSGTTGLPKGVPVTHLGFALNTQAMLTDAYTGVGIYNSREFYYSYGLFYGLACLRVAATIVYNIKDGQEAMLKAIQKYKLRVLQLAPVSITELTKSAILDNYDVSTVEYIVSSSTYIREEAVKAIQQRMPKLVSILQMYGMSEAGSICYEFNSSKGSRPGSSGTPCYGFVIKVVDLETREPLGPNKKGEICIKGPSVVKAYLNNVNPDSKDEEGFLKTGDVGYYDDDGYFYILSRIKELIKYNDVSIAPAEFEALLLQHPSVREAGVVGKPHPLHGEDPVAFIVLQPRCTATEEELVEHVHSRVTYKMRLAGGVRFIDSLPRNGAGKIDRQELLQRAMKEDANPKL